MLCWDDNILQLKFQSVALFFSIEFMGRDLCITHFLLPKQFFLKKIEKVPLTYSSELIESFLTFDSYYYCLFSVRSNVRPRGFKAHDLWLFLYCFFSGAIFAVILKKGRPYYFIYSWLYVGFKYIIIDYYLAKMIFLLWKTAFKNNCEMKHPV